MCMYIESSYRTVHVHLYVYTCCDGRKTHAENCKARFINSPSGLWEWGGGWLGFVRVHVHVWNVHSAVFCTSLEADFITVFRVTA